MYAIVVGTNRSDSKSQELAHYYSALLKDQDVESEIVNLKDLPVDFTHSALYGNNGKNPHFNVLRDIPDRAEKVIFIIAEYNGSYPGILKCFIDGFAYPNPLKNKKAALVGISSGNLGASLALSHFTDVLNYLGCHVHAIKPRLFPISEQLQDGEILDDLMRLVVQEQVAEFVKF